VKKRIVAPTGLPLLITEEIVLPPLIGKKEHIRGDRSFDAFNIEEGGSMAAFYYGTK
jgi:hypothetical protein